MGPRDRARRITARRGAAASGANIQAGVRLENGLVAQAEALQPRVTESVFSRLQCLQRWRTAGESINRRHHWLVLLLDSLAAGK